MEPSQAKCGGCFYFVIPGTVGFSIGPYCTHEDSIRVEDTGREGRLEWDGALTWLVGVDADQPGCRHHTPMDAEQRKRLAAFDAFERRRLLVPKMVVTIPISDPPGHDIHCEELPKPEPVAEPPVEQPVKRGRGRPKGSKDKKPRQKKGAR